MPFDRIQRADLRGWTGDVEAPGWRKVIASIGDLIGGPGAPAVTAGAVTAPARPHSICVLPFANMSGDPEQEYFSDGRQEEAAAEIAIALRLDPASSEVNIRAGVFSYRQRRLEDAVRYFEIATAQAETSFNAPSLLVSCYTALGDRENARRAAQITLARTECIVAEDRSNGMAMEAAVTALAVLGEVERAKAWMARALLIDPENMLMRYNFACALIAHLHDADAALEMLGSVLAQDPGHNVRAAKTDPDFDVARPSPLQGHARRRGSAARGGVMAGGRAQRP